MKENLGKLTNSQHLDSISRLSTERSKFKGALKPINSEDKNFRPHKNSFIANKRASESKYKFVQNKAQKRSCSYKSKRLKMKKAKNYCKKMNKQNNILDRDNDETIDDITFDNRTVPECPMFNAKFQEFKKSHDYTIKSNSYQFLNPMNSLLSSNSNMMIYNSKPSKSYSTDILCKCKSS